MGKGRAWRRCNEAGRRGGGDEPQPAQCSGMRAGDGWRAARHRLRFTPGPSLGRRCPSGLATGRRDAST
ncbi:hypothetical protein XHC_0945 [Xanthomonas hortorum pv. carotae str. M081]|nr:hypothetical protein XHC_0945 [Xanthomonas hortorum pv. carotae str. M081]